MNKLSKMRICDLTLIGLTVVTLASSIQLEITHCGSAGWVWVHVIAATAFISLIGWHLYLHFQKRNWVTMICAQKSPVTRWLAMFCILTVIFAIIALIHWEGTDSHSTIGGVHGKIGLGFIAFCIGHMIKRIKSPVLRKKKLYK